MLPTDGQVNYLRFLKIQHSSYNPIFHTDNVFSVKSWCKNRFGMEESSMDKQFGIPEDFDYID